MLTKLHWNFLSKHQIFFFNFIQEKLRTKNGIKICEASLFNTNVAQAWNMVINKTSILDSVESWQIPAWTSFSLIYWESKTWHTWLVKLPFPNIHKYSFPSTTSQRNSNKENIELQSWSRVYRHDTNEQENNASLARHFPSLLPPDNVDLILYGRWKYYCFKKGGSVAIVRTRNST